ncbi:hypothetical protein BRYFOR_05430 [Marvinbryantia formatexigens DSM 14469]|uniref:Uncharacterized protein n=1 Tax=Marvinbryantia formatexigens DSM 14469 TaxID=478749 RepID=C6L9Y8_9FIRM|nr:hypothetical protein BRYFOR_05430 [Marvinbryantia formatexigens DSM 14469]
MLEREAGMKKSWDDIILVILAILTVFIHAAAMILKMLRIIYLYVK